jgi:rRNA-processing protein EBP2
MAKKNKGDRTKKSDPAAVAKKEDDRVTLEALQAMSDSDDEQDVPESQWNTQAKNLARAIADGKFDQLLQNSGKKGEENEDDEIEEVILGDESSEGDDEESEQEVVNMDDDEEEEEEGGAPEKVPEQEDDDEEEDDEENEKQEAKEPSVAHKNTLSAKALRVVTEELKVAKSGMPWAETLEIISPTPLPFGEHGDAEFNPLDIHDDLKREVAFYDLALGAVKEARKKCKEAKIPFTRPDDFFVEMVKTDGKRYIAMCRVCLVFIVP